MGSPFVLSHVLTLGPGLVRKLVPRGGVNFISLPNSVVNIDRGIVINIRLRSLPNSYEPTMEPSQSPRLNAKFIGVPFILRENTKILRFVIHHPEVGLPVQGPV